MIEPQKLQYQRLKSSLFPALYEDKDSFFYYLYEKKLNRKNTLKNQLLKILRETNDTNKPPQSGRADESGLSSDRSQPVTTGELQAHLPYEKRARPPSEKQVSLPSEKQASLSFYNIVEHLILKEDIDTLIDFTLGEKVSSSKKAILCGYDSCLSCIRDEACTKKLSTLNYSDRVNYLLYLRFVKSKEVLSALKWGVSPLSFGILLKEPILMKYTANYSLVVDVKNELKKEGKIKNHKTLYKGTGNYCPFDDIYQLT